VAISEDPDDDERQRLAELAPADWSGAAGARVHSVVLSGRRAVVNLLLTGDYEYAVSFARSEDGHGEGAGSSSGHADASWDGNV